MDDILKPFSLFSSHLERYSRFRPTQVLFGHSNFLIHDLSVPILALIKGVSDITQFYPIFKPDWSIAHVSRASVNNVIM